ncbi:hypothetical protein ACJ41O_009339 [Fusarium nematophilum]
MCITLVVHFTDCDTRRQSTINTEAFGPASTTRSPPCPYHKACSPGKLRICPFSETDRPCPDGDVYHHVLPSILNDPSLELVGELSDIDDWSDIKLKPEAQHSAMDLRDCFFVGRLKLWLLAGQGTQIVNHLDGGDFRGSAWEEAALVQEHGELCAQWTARRGNLLGLLGAWEKLASNHVLEASPRAVAVHESGYVHEEVEDFPRLKGQGTPFKWMDNILIQDALLVNHPHYARQARGNLRWEQAESRREQVEQWWESHCRPSARETNFEAAIDRAAANIRQYNGGAAPSPHPVDTRSHEDTDPDCCPEYRGLSPFEQLPSPLLRGREQSEEIAQFASVSWDGPARTPASALESPLGSTRIIPAASEEDQWFVYLQSQFPLSPDPSEDLFSDTYEAGATIEELDLGDASRDLSSDLNVDTTDGELALGHPSEDPFGDRFTVDAAIGVIDLGDRSEGRFGDFHEAGAIDQEVDLGDFSGNPFSDSHEVESNEREPNFRGAFPDVPNKELELGEPSEDPFCDRHEAPAIDEELDLGDSSESPFGDSHKADAPSGENDLEDPLRDLDEHDAPNGELNLGDPNDLPETDCEDAKDFPGFQHIIDFLMAGPPYCLETHSRGCNCEEAMPTGQEETESLKRKRDEQDAVGEEQQGDTKKREL